MSEDLVELRREGLYCARGDFYIDPVKRVPRAVITHAHGDHAKAGCGRYWTAAPGRGLLRERLGRGAIVEALPYGEAIAFGGTRVSLHPAGHILGSAQVRIECEGRVWVVSGDYKRDDDPSCAPFEALPCDVFVTEATFAMPQHRWPDPHAVAAEIHAWWQDCKYEGKAALLFCYALGKAQRILAELTRYSDETVCLHPSMNRLVKLYRDEGIRMLPTVPAGNLPKGTAFAGRLILAPPNVAGTSWVKRFAPFATGFASGWMGEDGSRRSRYDRGFVLSDHADWDALLRSVRETGARRVLLMHGQGEMLVDHLRALGIDAAMLAKPAPVAPGVV
jgi:putative mRNA 3-end processing factor